MHSTNPIYLVRPWINIKKFCHEKKQMNWAKKPAAWFNKVVYFIESKQSLKLQPDENKKSVKKLRS